MWITYDALCSIHTDDMYVIVRVLGVWKSYLYLVQIVTANKYSLAVPERPTQCLHLRRANLVKQKEHIASHLPISAARLLLGHIKSDVKSCQRTWSRHVTSDYCASVTILIGNSKQWLRSVFVGARHCKASLAVLRLGRFCLRTHGSQTRSCRWTWVCYPKTRNLSRSKFSALEPLANCSVGDIWQAFIMLDFIRSCLFLRPPRRACVYTHNTRKNKCMHTSISIYYLWGGWTKASTRLFCQARKKNDI